MTREGRVFLVNSVGAVCRSLEVLAILLSSSAGLSGKGVKENAIDVLDNNSSRYWGGLYNLSSKDEGNAVFLCLFMDCLILLFPLEEENPPWRFITRCIESEVRVKGMEIGSTTLIKVTLLIVVGVE
jgi:hypothetical protein